MKALLTSIKMHILLGRQHRLPLTPFLDLTLRVSWVDTYPLTPGGWGVLEGALGLQGSSEGGGHALHFTGPRTASAGARLRPQGNESHEKKEPRGLPATLPLG